MELAGNVQVESSKEMIACHVQNISVLQPSYSVIQHMSSSSKKIERVFWKIEGVFLGRDV